jgi:adenine phosphoribosyltransferase
MDFTVDTIVAIESRGFVFGSAVARDLEVPFVMARKPGKLPNETVSKEFKLEYGETELHLQKISPIQGRVVVIDDLIATGGTALACADLIHENFDIAKKDILILAVIDLPDLKGSAIIQEQGYNVKTLIEFEGE